MSSIKLTIAPIEETVDEILDFIEEFYQREDYDLEIENELHKLFDELKEDLWTLIEYPYVDKVYRDSYYSYFASKHNAYARDCIRVSFFASEINHEEFRSAADESRLKNLFRGYLVIRPTFSCPIGRSLFDKRAFEEDDFVLCHYQGNVAINGVKLTVDGFPHSSQDAESISCAETTIWSVMEYFGNRYADYKPTYPSQIIQTLDRYSRQRMLPSNGLTVDQTSFALKEFGFGTSVYARDGAYGEEIENIIAYYIESGIPVIASIENDSIAHAIVIIGHEKDTTTNFNSVKKRKIDYPGGQQIEYVDYTDVPKKYLVNDDNLAPYRKIGLNAPSEHYTDRPDFLGCTIESVVVPLYKKIYLEVTKARELALAIVSDSDFGFAFQPGFVFRFFLTSSRSFKEHISRLPELPANQKDLLILVGMPKFIWCAEYYVQADFQNHIAAGLLVIDATEANQVWMDSLIFAGYPDRIVIKSETEFVPLQESFTGYLRFKNNLD
jgi:Papain-like cysteine protease AvrRpt2